MQNARTSLAPAVAGFLCLLVSACAATGTGTPDDEGNQGSGSGSSSGSFAGSGSQSSSGSSSGSGGSGGVGGSGQGGSGSSASSSGAAGSSGSGTAGSGSGSGTGSSTGPTTFTAGYYTAGPWHGYAWTSASGGNSSINPMDFSTVAAGKALCASGSVASLADDSGVAMIGVNLNQEMGTNTAVGTVTPSLDGITVAVMNTGGSPLRLQIQGPNGATDANDRWCAPITGTGGFVPWSAFNTECWAPSGGTAYAKQPLSSAEVLVPGTDSGAVNYNFCVDSLAPTATGGTTPAQDAGAGGSSGSGGGGTADASPGTLGGSGTITGAFDYDAVTRDGRNYIVQNNVWGGTSNQALSYDGTTFTVTQQNGSNSTSGQPISYPSVFIGSNNGRSTPGDNLPKAVTALTTVPTTWTNNAGSISGTYNAAYDVWFSTSSAGDSGSPSGGFLMVWYYKPQGAQPIGSVKYSGVTVSGASGTYDVWIGMNGSVPCISYVRTQSIQSMSYDLNQFIQDAVNHRPGTIQSGWYLTNVYAGFEIWNGGAGLKTTSFSVVVN